MQMTLAKETQELMLDYLTCWEEALLIQMREGAWQKALNVLNVERLSPRRTSVATGGYNVSYFDGPLFLSWEKNKDGQLEIEAAINTTEHGTVPLKLEEEGLWWKKFNAFIQEEVGKVRPSFEKHIRPFLKDEEARKAKTHRAAIKGYMEAVEGKLSVGAETITEETHKNIAIVVKQLVTPRKIWKDDRLREVILVRGYRNFNLSIDPGELNARMFYKRGGFQCELYEGGELGEAVIRFPTRYYPPQDVAGPWWNDLNATVAALAPDPVGHIEDICANDIERFYKEEAERMEKGIGAATMEYARFLAQEI